MANNVDIKTALEEERSRLMFEFNQKYNEFLSNMQESILYNNEINFDTRMEALTAVSNFYIGMKDTIENAPEETKVEDTDAYGMWADREEMKDPVAYVQKLRNTDEDDYNSLTELIVDNFGRIYVPKSVLEDAGLTETYAKIITNEKLPNELHVIREGVKYDNKWEWIHNVNFFDNHNLRINVKNILGVSVGDPVYVKAYGDGELVIYK